MTSSIPTAPDKGVCIGARCRQRLPCMFIFSSLSILLPVVGQCSPEEQRASRIFASIGTSHDIFAPLDFPRPGSAETTARDPTPCRPQLSSAALLVDGYLCVTPEPHIAGVV